MKKLLLTIAIIATAAASNAAVITETLNFGSITGDKQLYFNQFNTALGTLNSVTLSWTISSSISSASITNQNTGTVNVSRIAFTNTVDAYVPALGMPSDSDPTTSMFRSKNVTPTSGSVTLNQGDTYNVTGFTFNPTYTDTTNYTSADTNFNAFKGTGQVPIFLTNTFGATPTASGSGSTTSWLTSITGSSTGNLVVTYDYTAIAPVPEPSPFILGCGGLFFMSAFAFKVKKRKAAKPEATV